MAQIAGFSNPEKKYKLSIKIVEGRNLISADKNGFSDPYLVFKLISASMTKKKMKIAKKKSERSLSESSLEEKERKQGQKV